MRYFAVRKSSLKIKNQTTTVVIIIIVNINVIIIIKLKCCFFPPVIQCNFVFLMLSGT